MGWAICLDLILIGAIAQLRFQCLSQNNNYILPKTKAVKKIYFYLSTIAIFEFIIISIGILIDSVFLQISVIIAVLSLAFICIKSILYKTKLKFTKRGLSNIALSEIIYLGFVIISLLLIKNIYICSLTVCSYLLGIPIFVLIANFITNKYFVKINKEYILKQKEKLDAINPIVIGITGSYGKTSCKKILAYLLQSKYNVYATEKNFNTPMGIALSIEKMGADQQVFIMECGARKKGDISELCELYNPQYGIITGICEQHTESLGDIMDICDEKYNLAKYVASSGGVTVFNINDKNVYKMWKNHRGKRLSSGVNKKADVYAFDIKMSERGSEFKISFKNSEYFCSTKLLGRHNILNIIMCSTLAYELGCDPQNIVDRIKSISAIEHRLEYKYQNGIHIIDDGYNGNIIGVKSAMEVMSFFPKKHIIVAQGIVELGNKTKEINYEVGRLASQVADMAILSGTNAKYIKEGLLENGFVGKIFLARNMNEIKNYIKNNVKLGDTVLFQNDLPDIY